MLKTALIGFGYWGAKLARNFQNLETEVLGGIGIEGENESGAEGGDPPSRRRRLKKIDIVGIEIGGI